MEEYKIPYGRQNITEEDIEAVVSTLKSDYLTQGPKVQEFEDAFAKYVGAKYAVAVSNATAGLHIAVLALDLQPNERVITTPITFAASANCVRYAGGEVWFADIDPDTYVISFEAVKKLVESKPKGFFKGIIPVDFGGLPVNMEAFRELANKHNLWLIEDACHAPGGNFIDSKKNKIACGDGTYADMGIFSFHPVKHIACGEGGMVTTNSIELYKKLVMLRSHGITREAIDPKLGGWYYEMQSLGFNYRLTDMQSALGISQLKRNDQSIEKRNEIANIYMQAFQGRYKWQNVPTNFLNAYHLFIIEVPNRKELYDYLRMNGVFAQIHYIPVHHLPYYAEIGYAEAELTHAESYYSKCISLPMYPTLTADEQSFVIQLIHRFFDAK